MSVATTSTALAYGRPAAPAVDPPFAHQLLERTLEHFFPDARLYALGRAPEHADADMALVSTGNLAFNWFGARYGFARERPLSVLERLLVETILDVLQDFAPADASVRGPDRSVRTRGWLEDRCVATFLASGLAYGSADMRDHVDTLAAAIEVVRHAAATTHENRRITTGALIAVPDERPRGRAILVRRRPVRYEWPLRGAKTLYRICDGFRTLAVVDGYGYLVSIADVDCGTAPDDALPYPIPSRYAAHAAATIDGRHACLVLNASGVIHLFANGVQVFSFCDGRWRLRALGEKVAVWEQVVGNRRLADRLLRAAIGLSEERLGCLLVVADDLDSEDRLISASDRLDPPQGPSLNTSQPFHYLFRGANILTMPHALVQTAASIDGAIVLRRNGDLVAVGAILRGDGGIVGVEGARTTAAIAASRFATVLKVSEDGEMSMFRSGRRVWTL
jgi:DNA integrity scanning protein DisA with diadenylate cyclase activity